VRGGMQINQVEIESDSDWLRARGILATTDVETTQAYLDFINAEVAAISDLLAQLEKIPDIDPSKLTLPGGKGGGAEGQSLAQQVLEAQRQREIEQMGSLGQALAAINDKWDKALADQHLSSHALDEAARAHAAAIKAAKGNAEAIKAADAAYQRQLHHIHETEEAIDAANKEREKEIALARQQATKEVYGKIKDWNKDPNASGTPQGQYAEILAQGQSLREEFLLTAKEAGWSAERVAKGLERIDAGTRVQIKALTDNIVNGLGLPMQSAAAKAKGLGDTISFLRARVADGTISAQKYGEVIGEMSRQSGNELLQLAGNILDQMSKSGVAAEESAKIKAALDEANFDLQVAQLNFLYQQYLTLGLISDEVKKRLDEALGIINDPKNRPTFDWRSYMPQDNASSTSAATSAANSAEQQRVDDERRRKEILDQIAEWNHAGESDAVQQLRQLREKFDGMVADAHRLGIELSQLQGAYGNAVADFWDKTLKPFEQASTQTAAARLAEINKQFDELIAAAQQFGGDASRIEADRRAEIAGSGTRP
jgi:hypothetical protein